MIIIINVRVIEEIQLWADILGIELRLHFLGRISLLWYVEELS